MSDVISKQLEDSVIKLVNDGLSEAGVYLEKHQTFNIYVFDQTILNNILKECKFKDVGNIYDFPNDLPQPEVLNSYDISYNYDLFQRIAVSKKYNSILFYNADKYSICCTFLIDIDSIKKFMKIIKKLTKKDSNSNIFRDTDFSCKQGEYIELSDPMDEKTKLVAINKKEVTDENLVFDAESTINSVMNDIITFFKKDTKKLYGRLKLAYKRGIILYGDPGNGKSAMIREIIRVVPDIIKIIINPNVSNVTKILQSLTRALDGQQAIVVIEDRKSVV